MEYGARGDETPQKAAVAIPPEPWTFPHTPSSARAARREVHRIATTFTTDEELLDDIAVLVSEGVTNAYLHGTGTISVTVTHAEARLRVEVRDHGPRDLHDDRGDNGRGLELIRAFADRWGLDLAACETRLWFEVAIP